MLNSCIVFFRKFRSVFQDYRRLALFAQNSGRARRGKSTLNKGNLNLTYFPGSKQSNKHNDHLAFLVCFCRSSFKPSWHFEFMQFLFLFVFSPSRQCCQVFQFLQSRTRVYKQLKCDARSSALTGVCIWLEVFFQMTLPMGQLVKCEFCMQCLALIFKMYICWNQSPKQLPETYYRIRRIGRFKVKYLELSNGSCCLDALPFSDHQLADIDLVFLLSKR